MRQLAPFSQQARRMSTDCRFAEDDPAKRGRGGQGGDVMPDHRHGSAVPSGHFWPESNRTHPRQCSRCRLSLISPRRQPAGHVQRLDHAAGLRLTFPGDVKCRAVGHAGADDRQTQRDVYGPMHP